MYLRRLGLGSCRGCGGEEVRAEHFSLILLSCRGCCLRDRGEEPGAGNRCRLCSLRRWCRGRCAEEVVGDVRYRGGFPGGRCSRFRLNCLWCRCRFGCRCFGLSRGWLSKCGGRL